jgi:hypothetical protein
MSLLDEEGCVELYGRWDGDERDKAEHEEEIVSSRLLDERFWFRERGPYRFRLAGDNGDRHGVSCLTFYKPG